MLPLIWIGHRKSDKKSKDEYSSFKKKKLNGFRTKIDEEKIRSKFVEFAEKFESERLSWSMEFKLMIKFGLITEIGNLNSNA